MPKWYGESCLNPDNIIPISKQWVLQWNRVERWYNRVLKVHQKSLKQELCSSDQDIVIAFLQNSWHLKDWLNKSLPEQRTEIDQFFHSSFVMKACRDICNGFKHKKIDDPSLDADFNLFQEYDHFESVNCNKIKYKIAFQESGGIRKIDLFHFAADVYKKLRDFLDKTT